MNFRKQAVVSINATPESSFLKESLNICYPSLLIFTKTRGKWSKRFVMSTSKIDPIFKTEQPDLFLSYSLSHFCHFHQSCYNLENSSPASAFSSRFHCIKIFLLGLSLALVDCATGFQRFNSVSCLWKAHVHPRCIARPVLQWKNISRSWKSLPSVCEINLC